MPVYFENGRRLPSDRQCIDVMNRGFLYGETAFETMRLHQGRIFRLADHLARLEQSAAVLSMEMGLAAGELEAELGAAVEESGFETGSVRFTLVRKESGAGLRLSGDSEVLRYVTISALPEVSEALRSEGLRTIAIKSEALREFPPARGKFGNYIPKILALNEARRAGADDALLLSWDGFALGGSSSNVFYVKGGVLGTSPLGAGILEGVTRKVVIEIAREIGLGFREEWLAREEFPTVEEMFFTSSLRGPIPVRSIGDEVRFEAENRPVFSLLAAHYARRLDGL